MCVCLQVQGPLRDISRPVLQKKWGKNPYTPPLAARPNPGRGRKVEGGICIGSLREGTVLWMHREPSWIVGASLWMCREASGIMGVPLTGPANAQGAQWACTVSGDGPGVQRDCVIVCVCLWGKCRQIWLRVRSSIFHTRYRIFYILCAVCEYSIRGTTFANGQGIVACLAFSMNSHAYSHSLKSLWEGGGLTPKSKKFPPKWKNELGCKIDWCYLYYFVRNSLIALLKALCAQN